MKKVSLISLPVDDLVKYRDDCFTEIKKNSKDFYGILLNNGFGDDDIKANIGKIHTYFEDYKRWQTIKTYDDVLSTGEKYGYNLKFDGKNVYREVEILKPYKDFLDYSSKFICKDFPDSFNSVTNKKIDNKNLVYDCWEEIQKKSWVYITGPMKSGRTYCAIALINGSAANGNTNLAFLDSAKEMRVLCDLFFDNKDLFVAKLNKLKSAYFLVLDGFGNEYINEIVRDSIVIPLLRYRAQNDLMTVFTSDFTIDELLVLYSKKDNNNIRAKQLGLVLHSKITKEIETSVSIYE